MRATGNNGHHLVHRVKFWDRLPTAEDVAEIGYLDNGKFIKIAETTAWNFQQGAMLQYHPFLENTVYYNVYENGDFRCELHARFILDGKAISFDTTCNNKREIITLPITALDF